MRTLIAMLALAVAGCAADYQLQLMPHDSGKIYYGCCEMCKDRLANDAKLRAAVDPYSRKEVNKADAVLAQDSNGSVFYFENDTNLDAFNAKIAK